MPPHKSLQLDHLLGNLSENQWRNLLTDLVEEDPAPLIAEVNKVVADADRIDITEPAEITVAAESNRLDLRIDINDQPRICIEAKTKDSFQDNQLKKYEELANAKWQLAGPDRVVLLVLSPRFFTQSEEQKRAAGGTPNRWLNIAWEDVIRAYAETGSTSAKVVGTLWQNVTRSELLTEEYVPSDGHVWVEALSGSNASQTRAKMQLAAIWMRKQLTASFGSDKVTVVNLFGSRSSRPVVEIQVQGKTTGTIAFAHVLEHSTNLNDLKGPMLQIGIASSDPSKKATSVNQLVTDEQLDTFVAAMYSAVQNANANGMPQVTYCEGKSKSRSMKVGDTTLIGYGVSDQIKGRPTGYIVRFDICGAVASNRNTATLRDIMQVLTTLAPALTENAI